MADKPILEKTFNENLDVEKLIGEGSILARIFIEVQSNDKEMAEKALKSAVLDSLVSEAGVDLLNVKFYELKKDGEGESFSGVTEVELLFRDFKRFVSVAMRYGPSAIEIIDPHSIKLSLDEMHSILIDVCSFSHTLSSQLMGLLKDKERKALYERMLSKTGGENV